MASFTGSGMSRSEPASGMHSEHTTTRRSQVFELDDDGIPVEPALRFFRRRQRTILVAALLGGSLALTYAMISPAKFTATSSFTPQAAIQQSSLAGLASQLGVPLPNADLSRSPAFYADLLVTREVLGSVADSIYSYDDKHGAHRGTYVALADIPGASPKIRRDRGVVRLRQQMNVVIAQRTGMVTVAVTTTSAELSFQLLQQLLKQVDQFNRSTRQSQAAAERRFAEQRLEQVSADLRNAENALQNFLQENRGDFRNSPQLSFREQRLQREVTLRQAVFTTLSQSVEQAKIEAVRDTPLITVIDSPEVPSQADSRGLLQRTVTGMALGLGLGILGGLIIEARSRHQAASPPSTL